MTHSPLIKKLRIQPGQRLLFVNAPEGFVESLNPLPEGAQLSPSAGLPHDYVHLFVVDNIGHHVLAKGRNQTPLILVSFGHVKQQIPSRLESLQIAFDQADVILDVLQNVHRNDQVVGMLCV